MRTLQALGADMIVIRHRESALLPAVRTLRLGAERRRRPARPPQPVASLDPAALINEKLGGSPG